MPALTYRPIKVWPEGWDPTKPVLTHSPFSSTWGLTLDLLDRELHQLVAEDAVLQVAAPSDREFRLDGGLRADAKLTYPGVILSFRTPRHGTLSYPCNRFGGGGYGSKTRPGWQENVRAIALGLEALRKVERYGIAERGQQYAGWAELPSGIAMPAAMTLDEAARILHDAAPEYPGPAALIGNKDLVKVIYRAVVPQHHPDHGGDPETFRRLTEARDLLLEHAA